MEKSLEAEALALERPRETQLRHIAPRISRRRRTRGENRRGFGGVAGRTWVERRAAVEKTTAGEVGRGRSFCLFSSREAGLLLGPFCPYRVYKDSL